MTALLHGKTYLLPLLGIPDLTPHTGGTLRDGMRDIAHFVLAYGGTLCFTHAPEVTALLNAVRKHRRAKHEQLVMVGTSIQSAQDLLDFGATHQRTVVACAVLLDNLETVECVADLKKWHPQLRVLPFLGRPGTKTNLPEGLADPSFMKMWERNWRLPLHIQLEKYTASMYRVIRCYEHWELAIVASPPNAGPDTEQATFYRFANWKIGDHEPFKLNPISGHTALGYFSGHADSGGWAEPPSFDFATLEEAEAFLKAKRAESAAHLMKEYRQTLEE